MPTIGKMCGAGGALAGEGAGFVFGRRAAGLGGRGRERSRLAAAGSSDGLATLACLRALRTGIAGDPGELDAGLGCGRADRMVFFINDYDSANRDIQEMRIQRYTRNSN